MVESSAPVNWDDFEKEQSRDYVGVVIASEVRNVPPERYLEWTSQPNEGVTPQELYIAVRPLDHALIRTNRAGEEVDFFEYEIGMTAKDGSFKRKNSGIGAFREAARKLGFPDPTTLSGRTFNISETTQSYGGDIKGRVTLLTGFLRDGYTHEGDLPTWDFRKKAAEGVPDVAPSVDAAEAGSLTTETGQALAVLLDDVKEDDTSAINDAGRHVGQATVVRGLQYNDELIPTLKEMGFIKVTKGVIRALAAQPA